MQKAVRGLGLVLDSTAHAFVVPENKLVRLLADIATVREDLRVQGGISPAAGGHIAGVCMALSAAVPTIREQVNMLYAVCSGRVMEGAAGISHAW